MELTRVTISKFKRISKVQFELDDLNVVIGGNNSGKSSLLQAIHTAVTTVQSVRERGISKTVAEDSLRYAPTGDFAALGYLGKFGNRKTQNRASITFQGKSNKGDAEYSVDLYRGRNARNVGISETGAEGDLGKKIGQIDPPFSIYVPGLAGIPLFEEYRSFPIVLRKLAGGEANLVLRNILLMIKEKGQLDELCENMREFFPEFSLSVNYDNEVDMAINVEVDLGNGYAHPIELCGTGVLQAIQIFSYVTLFKPVILLLDEPDSHLHPSNQIKLIEVLDFLNVLYGTKVIIATHSRHILSCCNRKAQFLWMQEGKLRQDEQIDLAEILIDIGGLDDIDNLIGKKKDFIIFTEDEKKPTMKKLLTSIEVDEKKYGLVSYDGISNSKVASRIISSLKDYLKGKPKFIIHRDRDFHLDAELDEFREEFEKRNCSVFVTYGSDIESYFLNVRHLEALLPASQLSKDSTQSGGDIIKECIQETLYQYDDEIRKKYKRKREEINKSKIYYDGGSPKTSDLCPDDEALKKKHVVGKEFCRYWRKYTKERFGRPIEPLVVSKFVKCPELIDIIG